MLVIVMTAISTFLAVNGCSKDRRQNAAGDCAADALRTTPQRSGAGRLQNDDGGHGQPSSVAHVDHAHQQNIGCSDDKHAERVTHHEGARRPVRPGGVDHGAPAPTGGLSWTVFASKERLISWPECCGFAEGSIPLHNVWIASKATSMFSSMSRSSRTRWRINGSFESPDDSNLLRSFSGLRRCSSECDPSEAKEGSAVCWTLAESFGDGSLRALQPVQGAGNCCLEVSYRELTRATRSSEWSRRREGRRSRGERSMNEHAEFAL